jgi:hypothetical protein
MACSRTGGIEGEGRVVEWSVEVTAQRQCASADRNDGLDCCSEGGKQTLMTTVNAPDPLVATAVETFVVRRKPLPAPTAQTQAHPPPLLQLCSRSDPAPVCHHSPCSSSYMSMPPAPSAPRHRPHLQAQSVLVLLCLVGDDHARLLTPRLLRGIPAACYQTAPRRSCARTRTRTGTRIGHE